MRVESDGNPQKPSPHIMAKKLDDSYVFELWVEKECIMGNMGLATSISSFLHLVFCFNLKYPKVPRTALQSSLTCFTVHFFPGVRNSLWFPPQSFGRFWKWWRSVVRNLLRLGLNKTYLGTRTNKSKTTAESKLVKYHIQLGKVLGARNV